MSERLALDGGTPVRASILPYGRQSIDDDDVAAVTGALRSAWLTTGPKVGEFEAAFAAHVGAREGVAISNGTAALHAAVHAAGVGPGDEVIVPPMTFAATANAVLYCGGRPVFADVDAGTLLIDPQKVEAAITPKTKAIIGVDYGGQPCDSGALRELAAHHGLYYIADACHALGADDGGRPVGTLADLSTFSLHPVKPMTTGEGGVITTDDPVLAQKMRVFRNHGITSDHRSREKTGSYFYEMVELGYNYRLTDLQCALGLSQLRRLDALVAARRQLAATYDRLLANHPTFRPLEKRPGASHAYHLYVVKLDLGRLSRDRDQVFAALRAEGIGINVHYIPVHLHPYYRDQLGTRPGLCPVAETVWQQILTLPLFAGMTDADVADVVRALDKVTAAWGR
jgi:perosamine synthetase